MRSPLLLFVVACLVRPASSALSIRPFSLHADTEPSSLEAFSGEEGPLGVRRLLLDMTGPDALATPPTAGLEGRKHIIIFSQGQAGSLQVQRAVEGCVANATVVGEDRELWSLLWLGYEAWSNIARPELRGHEDLEAMTEVMECDGCQRNETGFAGSWWRELTEEDVLFSYRQLLRQKEQGGSSGSRVLGLKQQGQWPHDPVDFDRYANFLRLLLPGALVVVAVRNAEELGRTGWFEDEDLEDLRQIESTLRGYAEAHPDHAHVLTYGARRGGQEEALQQAAELFGFLQEPFDANCYLAATMGGRGGKAQRMAGGSSRRGPQAVWKKGAGGERGGLAVDR